MLFLSSLDKLVKIKKNWYIVHYICYKPIKCLAARSVETGDSLGIKSTEERRLRALRHEHNSSVTDVVPAWISQMAPDEGRWRLVRAAPPGTLVGAWRHVLWQPRHDLHRVGLGSFVPGSVLQILKIIRLNKKSPIAVYSNAISKFSFVKDKLPR